MVIPRLLQPICVQNLTTASVYPEIWLALLISSTSLLMPMNHVMLPHAKLTISQCMPRVITVQRVSVDTESTLLHRLTAILPTSLLIKNILGTEYGKITVSDAKSQKPKCFYGALGPGACMVFII